MSKKYLTASEIAIWVRCNRQFYYSRLYPDFNQNAPILLEGTRQHVRHSWNIQLQRLILILIFSLGLVILALLVSR